MRKRGIQRNEVFHQSVGSLATHNQTILMLFLSPHPQVEHGDSTELVDAAVVAPLARSNLIMP
jgi:hypothetical protein